VSTFKVGDRVRTTVDAPALNEDDWAVPVGTLGAITDAHATGGYGVLLDGDPDQLPSYYAAAELTPA
jgi:hypothetical protein